MDVKTKYLPIKKEDVQGNQLVIIEPDLMIKIDEFWEESNGKVYRYTKIENGKWVKSFIPFMKRVPFVKAKL